MTGIGEYTTTSEILLVKLERFNITLELWQRRWGWLNCLCTYIHICTCIDILYICVYMYMYGCMYINLYMYVCMYITYIFEYTQELLRKNLLIPWCALSLDHFGQLCYVPESCRFVSRRNFQKHYNVDYIYIGHSLTPSLSGRKLANTQRPNIKALFEAIDTGTPGQTVKDELGYGEYSEVFLSRSLSFPDTLHRSLSLTCSLSLSFSHSLSLSLSLSPPLFFARSLSSLH